MSETKSNAARLRELLADARPLIERRGLTLLGIALSNLADASAVQLALPVDGRSASAASIASDCGRGSRPSPPRSGSTTSPRAA